MWKRPLNETEIDIIRQFAVYMEDMARSISGLVLKEAGVNPHRASYEAYLSEILPQAFNVLAQKLEDWPKFKSMSEKELQAILDESWKEGVDIACAGNVSDELLADTTLASAKNVFDVKITQLLEQFSRGTGRV